MFNLEPNKRLVILSAEQAGASAAENAYQSNELRIRLSSKLCDGHIDSVIKCHGQYKGTPEASFLIICDELGVNTLENLAHDFGQECILVAGQRYNGQIGGTLYYPNGAQIGIGDLTLCKPGVDYDASTTIAGTDISFTFE